MGVTCSQCILARHKDNSVEENRHTELINFPRKHQSPQQHSKVASPSEPPRGSSSSSSSATLVSLDVSSPLTSTRPTATTVAVAVTATTTSTAAVATSLVTTVSRNAPGTSSSTTGSDSTQQVLIITAHHHHHHHLQSLRQSPQQPQPQQQTGQTAQNIATQQSTSNHSLLQTPRDISSSGVMTGNILNITPKLSQGPIREIVGITAKPTFLYLRVFDARNGGNDRALSKKWNGSITIRTADVSMLTRKLGLGRAMYRAVNIG
ncbi:probable serine/threonine-protein kinase roco5 [Topomyia yanbarensis]|uniref:probable serine/threonine-protein kinase roco5 n=1 Tax=Topomyia yanbarensis TaxID=2498891 RepID=UPI00273CA278|nr:probable serine/threonine-protein kinase roco5 [Topomyia yanbarensis]